MKFTLTFCRPCAAWAWAFCGCVPELFDCTIVRQSANYFSTVGVALYIREGIVSHMSSVNSNEAMIGARGSSDNAGGLPAPLVTPTGDNAGGNAGVETIEQRLGGLFGGDETKTKENANKDARLFSTFRDLEAGEVSRYYALQRLPERVSGAHVSGDIHFHDLDYTVPGGMFNCMLVDLPFILSREDFPIGNTRVNRVRSVETATDLIPQIAAQVSVGQYGGQTYSKLDEVLEPYVMYTYRRELARALENATRVAAEMGVAGVEPLDKSVALLVASGERDRMAAGVGEKIWDMSVAEAKKRTESIVYDSMEGVEYALNTVQGNGQTPFVTISFGLSTSWAGRVVQKAILKVRINGYGAQSKTPVFPKLVYMLKEGVNMRPGDPNYDVKRLALYCASKRIYPDFQSVDNTVRDLGFNPTSMGCRSFLSYYENPETGEPVEYGRFNVGVVTLNLPRIAMQTESTEEFMRLLDARAGIVREALDWRFDQVREATASQSPIHYVTGAAGVALSPSDKVGDLVEGGYATASMGYIGVYEAVARFYGGDWYSNREAVEFSVNIVRRLDELARSWKAESGRGYGVYGTPSESLCDRFARLDTRLFGEVEDITSKGYYQNSFHVDVRKNMSPFEKWRVEAQYLPYTTGGAIDYVETETLLKNPDALESIVDAAVAAGVRYFGVNQPVSQCFECDYSGEFAADVRGFYCPDCGERDEEKISVVRRVCGYLGSFADRPVVEGKRKEIVARVKHLRAGDVPGVDGDDIL